VEYQLQGLRYTESKIYVSMIHLPALKWLYSTPFGGKMQNPFGVSRELSKAA
jgi:hypothetical protein